MTFTDDLHHEPRTTDYAVSLAVAGRVIDALAVRDFDAIVAPFSPEVRFRALLPGRVLELRGRDAARGVFVRWFGNADRWELTEAVVGEVGGRIHLRWRVRLTDENIGEGYFMVEQQVYADAGADGHLCDIALLCSGYRAESS